MNTLFYSGEQKPSSAAGQTRLLFSQFCNFSFSSHSDTDFVGSCGRRWIHNNLHYFAWKEKSNLLVKRGERWAFVLWPAGNRNQSADHNEDADTVAVSLFSIWLKCLRDTLWYTSILIHLKNHLNRVSKPGTRSFHHQFWLPKFLCLRNSSGQGKAVTV